MNVRQLVSPFRDPAPLDPLRLQEHMLATYFRIRMCLAIVALAFPIVLAGGGYYVGGIDAPLLGSLSAYF